MTSDRIREKYIKFFTDKKHVPIDPSPLVLEDDPTTLFTSSGMQQLIPFLKGEKKHLEGNRLVNSQPCIRTQDIDEVGDNRHTTFFEMLGNWSLGDYFKEEQLSWFWEFLTKELKLDEKRLWVTVFEGTKEVPKDEESFEIWKKLGVLEERIRYYGTKENWWSRSGSPNKMPTGEIGGPDSEVFFEFTKVKHNSKFGKECHPNCECGRFLEIGNSVFIQYEKKKDGSLQELSQKSVDFGGGLERLVAVTEDNPDIFKIDVFKPIIKKIEKTSGKSYKSNKESIRVISDHIRAAEVLIIGGVVPGNKLQGYVLRKLIRRAGIQMWKMSTMPMTKFASGIVQNYKNESTIGKELYKFEQTLVRGSRIVERNKTIKPFDLYQTHGVPPEAIKEIYKKIKNIDLSKNDLDQFEKDFEKHRELSKLKSVSKFKGGLGDMSGDAIKLHTTTHLLHWALREVLGEGVHQEGSNITKERLRFDFSHSSKLTEKELEKVENLVNEKIKDALPVEKTIENKKEALKSGALAFFKENYPERVSVYSVGEISREFCGGPHVKNTKEIGRVRIKKQGKIGSNLVRVYVYLD